MDTVPELLTPTEVAEHLRVNTKTLYNWRHEGVGPPALKMGGKLRYRADELASWIKAGAPMDPHQAA